MKKFRLFLALGLLMVGLSAQGQTKIDGLWYDLNGGEAMVVVPPSGEPAYSGNIVIPATVSGSYDVTAIGERAFEGCTELQSVIIGKNVKVIHWAAFDGCGMLASVTFEEGSQLEEICYWAFINCVSLKKIELPESLKQIRECAFNGAGLKRIHIPAYVETIEPNPFAFCVSLEEIEVATGNANFSGIDGVLFTAGAKELVAYPAANKATEYTIPGSVEEIGKYAFANSWYLEEVRFPNALRNIGMYAFTFSKALKEVVFNEGLENIYGSAFSNSQSIESIALPSTLTFIGQEAFAGCDGVKKIASLAVTPPALGTNVFADVPAGTPLYVPTAAIANYIGDPWDNFTIKDMAELEKRAELFGLCDDMEALLAFGKALGIPASLMEDFENAYDAAFLVAANELSTLDDINDAITAANTAISTAIALLKAQGQDAFFAELDKLLEDGDSQDCKNIIIMWKVSLSTTLVWDDGKTVSENIAILQPMMENALIDAAADLKAQRELEEIEGLKDILWSVMQDMTKIGDYASTLFDITSDPDYDALYNGYGTAYDIYMDGSVTLEQVQMAIGDAEAVVSNAIFTLVPKMKYAMKEYLNLLVSGERDEVVQAAEDAKAAIDAWEWDFMESTFENLAELDQLNSVAQSNIDTAKSKAYVSDITPNSAIINWENTGATYSLRYKKALIMDFESGLAPFTTVDADGDGFTWFSNLENGGINPADGFYYYLTPNEGKGLAYSQSYTYLLGSPLTPDNWLISPEITLGGQIYFFFRSQDPAYPEHFGCYVSTTGTAPEDFTEWYEWTADKDYYEYSANDFSGLEGKGYIAFRHYDVTDQYILNLDDIEIVEDMTKADWVQLDDIPDGNLQLNGLDPDAYYSVQISADGGLNWSAVCVFKTTTPTDVEGVQTPEVSIQKVMQNGQLIIRRGDKSYNVLGAEVDR